MQEFSSVTASSYDPNALVALLNDRAADGWTVVSIVGAGTNVVAYLSREQTGTSDAAEPDAAVSTPTVPGDETTATTTGTTDPVEVSAADAVTEPEPAADEPVEPVTEPAGWAAAPEGLTETTVNPVVGGVTETAAASEPAPAAEAVADVPAQAAAPESAVPAGWYADPSGRFELRYWDGTAWTEHVSRAGQQYTDPPVA